MLEIPTSELRGIYFERLFRPDAIRKVIQKRVNSAENVEEPFTVEYEEEVPTMCDKIYRCSRDDKPRCDYMVNRNGKEILLEFFPRRNDRGDVDGMIFTRPVHTINAEVTRHLRKASFAHEMEQSISRVLGNNM